MTELVVRRPTLDDLDAVVELGNAFERVFADAESFTREDLADEWRQVDLERDAWLVDVNGGLAGYGILEDRGEGTYFFDGYVHPEQRGRGVGTRLVALGEEGARERRAVAVQTGRAGKDDAAATLFEGRGYRTVRHFYRMAIELGHEPEVTWPVGIRAEQFDKKDALRLHDSIEEAWQDHWDHRPRPFEVFRARVLGGSRYDPTLWTVAWDGDEIAGGAICEAGVYEMGWVRSLWVRRPWRKRGLGNALLLNAFRQFHERGERRVGLGVDAQSPTGATRLYERAGMRVVEESVVHRKELA